MRSGNEENPMTDSALRPPEKWAHMPYHFLEALGQPGVGIFPKVREALIVARDAAKGIE